MIMLDIIFVIYLRKLIISSHINLKTQLFFTSVHNFNIVPFQSSFVKRELGINNNKNLYYYKLNKLYRNNANDK